MDRGLSILQVSTHDVAGGAARSAYRLHRGLVERGHDCRMLVADKRSDDPTVSVLAPPRDLRSRLLRRAGRWWSREEASASRRARQSGADPFNDDRSAFDWRRAAPMDGCDVVHLHWVARFVDYRSFFDAVPPQVPVVWTFRDMNVFTGGCHYDEGCGRYTARCGACPQLESAVEEDHSRRVWERKREVFAALGPGRLHIVTPSRWMAEEVRRSSLLADRFPVTVIPNGVNTDDFAPRDRAAAREALGIPQDSRVLLFVAVSLSHRRKGFALLAEALGRLSGTPNLFLLSVGSSRPSLNVPVPQLHLGNISNDRLLSLAYNAADLYVIPSLQDNLPSTVLEAMACGTPVVGFDVGGVREMVRPGVTGDLVRVGDVAALAASVERLLGDVEGRSRMAACSRRVALDEYRMDLCVQRYEDLYRNSLKPAKPPAGLPVARAGLPRAASKVKPVAVPSLSDLPAPPAGTRGWPWDEESPRVPARMEDGRPWPRITVVTPSFNQAEFLEETIRSVLLQGYPDLQYIVIDGGSRDGSVEIIERYGRWLDHWVSEADRGQTHALNKGFARADGEILAWLNSDDIYYPGVLATVARKMEEDGCDLFLGAMDKVDVLPDRVRFVRRSSPNEGEPIHRLPVLADGRRYDFHFFQPSMFWRRDLWERAGWLDERYDYVMDIEWCNRALAAGPKVSTSDDVLTRFTLHPGSKSQEYAYRQRAEEALMYRRLARTPGFRAWACLAASLWPAQRAFSLRAAKALREEQRMKASLLRAGAGFVKLLSTLATRVYRRNAIREASAASRTRLSSPC